MKHQNAKATQPLKHPAELRRRQRDRAPSGAVVRGR